MSGQPPTPPPPQPQPFHFWLPLRSRAALSRPPRPMPMPSPPPTPPAPTPTPIAHQPASSRPPPLPPPHPMRTVEQEIPIEPDSNHGQGKIPTQTLESLPRTRSAAPKLDLELNISRPPPTDQEHGSSGSDGNKDTKIAISGFPRARLFDGGRAQYRREIEDGLKTLAGHEKPPPPMAGGEQSYRVMTLAGHNVGASMVLGASKDAPRTGEAPPCPASVNSNVQGVNNSAMEASSCSVGDAGVRVDVKSGREEAMAMKEPKEKAMEPMRRRPPLIPPREQRASPGPRVRRRCLRALMMESDSDTGRPRRHGCRLACADRKGKEVEDQAAPPPPPQATASHGAA